MKHFSEEELVLHFYREGIDHESVEEHLNDCRQCRSRLLEIERVLAAVGSVEVPEPSDDFEGHVWRRLKPALENPDRYGWLRFRGWPRWASAGALASLVLMAFLLGRFWPAEDPRVTQPISEPARERVLMMTVADHLERSQRLLLELVNTGENDDVDLSGEQRAVQELLESNRLYRRTASLTGERTTEALLEDLERILVEIASSPSLLQPEELEEVRQRIDALGLLFKTRVFEMKIRQQEFGPAGQSRKTL